MGLLYALLYRVEIKVMAPWSNRLQDQMRKPALHIDGDLPSAYTKRYDCLGSPYTVYPGSPYSRRAAGRGAFNRRHNGAGGDIVLMCLQFIFERSTRVVYLRANIWHISGIIAVGFLEDVEVG